MFQPMKLVALALLATAVARPAAAQTPAPPDWADKGNSVYLGTNETQPAQNEPVAIGPAAAAEAQPITTSRRLDPAVVSAMHTEQDAPREAPDRHLAPPSSRTLSEHDASAASRPSGASRRLVDFGVPMQSLYTMGTGLAIVVGAFLLFAWTLRRSGRLRAGRGMLPDDAVSVLGRVSLTSKQVAQLIKVGNKLVLVALTPGGAETLTEVTDPIEVDRLMGLCQQRDPQSATQAFEQVFQSFSRESAPAGFLGAESLPASISPVTAAYRSHRGEAARV